MIHWFQKIPNSGRRVRILDYVHMCVCVCATTHVIKMLLSFSCVCVCVCVCDCSILWWLTSYNCMSLSLSLSVCVCVCIYMCRCIWATHVTIMLLWSSFVMFVCNMVVDKLSLSLCLALSVCWCVRVRLCATCHQCVAVIVICSFSCDISVQYGGRRVITVCACVCACVCVVIVFHVCVILVGSGQVNVFQTCAACRQVSVTYIWFSYNYQQAHTQNFRYLLRVRLRIVSVSWCSSLVPYSAEQNCSPMLFYSTSYIGIFTTYRKHL